jgi:hypothetical protein
MRLSGAVTLIVLMGCSQRPYTSQRAALEARLSALDAAGSAASKALAEKAVDAGTPAPLSPPLVIEGPRSATTGNALLIPFEELKLLDQSDLELLRQGKAGRSRGQRSFGRWDFVGGGGLACAAEATRVLRHEDCGDAKCDASRAERCAAWLLGLRYAVFIETKVDTGQLFEHRMFEREEKFSGRAVIVELGASRVVDVIDFAGTAYNGEASAKFAHEVKEAFLPALVDLRAQLLLRHPGTPPPSGFPSPGGPDAAHE